MVYDREYEGNNSKNKELYLNAFYSRDSDGL